MKNHMKARSLHFVNRIATALLLLVFSNQRQLRADALSADSSRGVRLLETLSCLECHNLSGRGSARAPDLGQTIGREFTPSTLAAKMWNHAPRMWAVMRERDIAKPELDAQGAADLFAYFYSARFFEMLGDAARGAAVFETARCSACHGLTHSSLPGAKPVSEWESISQPISLVTAMWNHAAAMGHEFEGRNLRWSRLSAQDLTDLSVYLSNLPETRRIKGRLRLESGREGNALFLSKGCDRCHAGRFALSERLRDQTLTGIAASMWNHQPKMGPGQPTLTATEMAEIVSDIWTTNFFEDGGKASAGRRVYYAKRCEMCHEAGAPGGIPLRGRDFSSVSMVAALWRHGPGMFGKMQANKIAWPRFEGAQMSNLIAYLNSQR